MKYPPIQKRSVLITGCSSGIGYAASHLMRRRGWTVYPTARNARDVERLKSEGFKALPLDVAESGSIQTCVDQLLDISGGTLGGLVNNAGYGQPGAVEDLTREMIRRQFEANVFGMQELTNALIPVMKIQGYGRIVNVSSIVGLMSLPFFGAYSASKYAMEALSDAMRVELASAGIAVVLVEPGPIRSSFRKNAIEAAETNLKMETSRFSKLYDQEMIRRKLNTGDQKRAFMLSPEAVGEKILKGLTLTRPKARYLVTIPARSGAFLKRVAPDCMIDALMMKRWSARLGQDA